MVGINLILNSQKLKKCLHLLLRKYQILILLLIGITPILWYRQGHFIAKGDYFPSIFHIESMNNDFYLWSSNNLGSPSALSAFALYDSLATFLQVLSGDIGLWQIILHIIYFMGAAFSMFYLSKTVYPEQKSTAIIASIFYVLNIVTMQSLLNIGMMWTYAFLPLLIALFVRILTTTKNIGTHIIFFAFAFMIVGSISSINVADFALIVISLACVLVYYTVFERKIVVKQLVKNLTMLLAVTLPLSIWWIIPIINHYLLSSSMQLQPELNVVSGSWTQVRSSFLNLFCLNGTWGWRPEYSPYYDLYSSSAALLFLLFLPILISSAALLFKGEKRKFNAYAMLMILFFIFLAKGLHEPLGSVNLLLYEYIPYMNMFREPTSKFTLIIIPFLALLIGYSTDKTVGILAGSRFRKLREMRKLVVPALILAFIVTAFPLFTNPIENKTEQLPYSSYVKIPQYWYETNEWLNNKSGDFKILVTPLDDYYQLPYSWGYYGSDTFIERLIQKPVISPCFEYSYKINPNAVALADQLRDAVKGNRTDEFETIVRLLGVKYVLQRNDLDYEYIEAVGRDMPNPDRMKSFLLRQPNFRIVETIGKLDIYEYNKPQSYMRVLESEKLQECNIELKNETVFAIQWSFNSVESLNEWKNATLLNQFGAVSRLYLDGGALMYELWNSTWGWKAIASPLITAQCGVKYDIRFDIKGENAHEVHVKILEYDKSMTVTHVEYVSYGADGTFDWRNIRITYTPKIENTTDLGIAIWNGHETTKPLPNIIWVDNFEVEGYVTKLDISTIKDAFSTSEKNTAVHITQYKKISPTKMTVGVNSSQPFVLAVGEAYDPHWKAYINGETYNSVSIFSVMNGFQINRIGQMEIVIEYEPQEWFYYGSAISATTFLASLAYISYTFVRTKTSEESARTNRRKSA